ncbi:uncharacterized protein LOC127480713 [Manacus candei]|uniref:uncharacterized protein LOC127480713 n=1 Tax=Manacus candei TaxID=415023 RepID=UPI00222762B3|nr:uncharacterized protein LOC127480713 [Manacus candei]
MCDVRTLRSSAIHYSFTKHNHQVSDSEAESHFCGMNRHLISGVRQHLPDILAFTGSLQNEKRKEERKEGRKEGRKKEKQKRKEKKRKEKKRKEKKRKEKKRKEKKRKEKKRKEKKRKEKKRKEKKEKKRKEKKRKEKKRKEKKRKEKKRKEKKRKEKDLMKFMSVFTNCYSPSSKSLASQVKHCVAGILTYHLLSGSAGSVRPSALMFRAKL